MSSPPAKTATSETARLEERTRDVIAQAVIGRATWLPKVLAAPPVMGVALLTLVLSGSVSPSVMRSGAAMSAALLVAALLILVPPVLYARNPVSYLEHQSKVRDLVEEVLEAQKDTPTGTGGPTGGPSSPS